MLRGVSIREAEAIVGKRGRTKRADLGRAIHLALERRLPWDAEEAAKVLKRRGRFLVFVGRIGGRGRHWIAVRDGLAHDPMQRSRVPVAVLFDWYDERGWRALKFSAVKDRP